MTLRRPPPFTFGTGKSRRCLPLMDALDVVQRNRVGEAVVELHQLGHVAPPRQAGFLGKLVCVVELELRFRLRKLLVPRIEVLDAVLCQIGSGKVAHDGIHLDDRV